MTTRKALQQQLNKLERLMPDLVRKYPDRDDLMQEFCGHADVITEAASGADYEWANDALDKMLTRYGFPPQKDELPADG